MSGEHCKLSSGTIFTEFDDQKIDLMRCIRMNFMTFNEKKFNPMINKLKPLFPLKNCIHEIGRTLSHTIVIQSCHIMHHSDVTFCSLA